MKNFWLRCGILVILFLSSACADSLMPRADEDPHIGIGTAGPAAIILDPVVITVPGCDPYTDLNWCEGEGGNCISSGDSDPSEFVGLAGCGDNGGAIGGDRDGGGSRGGSGGGAPKPCPDYGCPTEPVSCDPQYDPECHQPLTTTDSATLQTAIERHRRDPSEFTDPAIAQQCSELIAEFDRLYAAGLVFRGGSDTPEGDPLTGTHVGAYDPVSGALHFEPSALDNANGGDLAAVRSVYITALHESAHSLGYTHTDPLWAGDYDLFAETPFNLLSKGTNTCIKW